MGDKTRTGMPSAHHSSSLLTKAAWPQCTYVDLIQLKSTEGFSRTSKVFEI